MSQKSMYKSARGHWLVSAGGQGGAEALTNTLHRQHTLGHVLVQEHVFNPEVEWHEEANFILGWKLAHIPDSKGGHRLRTQGTGTGLLPVDIGAVLPTGPPYLP